MSPEQVRGEELDARCDILSLGSVLYEMTTGGRPFVGPKPADIAREITEGQSLPIHERVPSVPFTLVRIIDKSLARNPKDRYQGLEDMAVDLTQLSRELESGSSLSYQSIHSPAISEPRPWTRALVSGISVVLLLLAGWWLLTRSPSTSPLESTVASNGSVAVFSFDNLKNPSDPDRLGQIFQELIITKLSGLDALRVVSSQRLFDLQKQVVRKDNQLGRETNTEVAVRAGAGRMLTGSISQR